MFHLKNSTRSRDEIRSNSIGIACSSLDFRKTLILHSVHQKRAQRLERTSQVQSPQFVGDVLAIVCFSVH